MSGGCACTAILWGLRIVSAAQGEEAGAGEYFHVRWHYGSPAAAYMTQWICRDWHQQGSGRRQSVNLPDPLLGVPVFLPPGGGVPVWAFEALLLPLLVHLWVIHRRRLSQPKSPGVFLFFFSSLFPLKPKTVSSKKMPLRWGELEESPMQHLHCFLVQRNLLPSVTWLPQ